MEIGDSFTRDGEKSTIIDFIEMEGYGKVVLLKRSDGVEYRLRPDLVRLRLKKEKE